MKKNILLLAIACMTLLALSQCEGNTEKDSNTSIPQKTEVTKGAPSQSSGHLDQINGWHDDWCKVIDRFNKAIQEAKTCHDLEEAQRKFIEGSGYLDEAIEDELSVIENQLTKEELQRIDEIEVEVEKLYSDAEKSFYSMAYKMGCEGL
jgi:hypothetical protein